MNAAACDDGLQKIVQTVCGTQCHKHRKGGHGCQAADSGYESHFFLHLFQVRRQQTHIPTRWPETRRSLGLRRQQRILWRAVGRSQGANRAPSWSEHRHRPTSNAISTGKVGMVVRLRIPAMNLISFYCGMSVMENSAAKLRKNTFMGIEKAAGMRVGGAFRRLFYAFDRRPFAWSLPAGMCCTTAGIIMF